MASIILSAAGQAIAPGVGGMLLGALGRAAGGIVDRKLGLTGMRKLEGPRLENLKVQDSRYGAGIPVIYGRARVAGQVIWASDLIETAYDDHVGAGGKGGGAVTATRYSYSVDCAVAVGMGPLARLAAAWADGKQIYDGVNWKSGLARSAQFYPGDEVQDADPVMEAALGVGNLPAYRGIAYVVFEGMQLADFGNRLPNLSFEIIANQASAAPRLGANANPGMQSESYGIGSRGGAPPLIVTGDTRRISEAVVLGMQNADTATSAATFVAVNYLCDGAVPVERARAVSPSFATDNGLRALAWSLSPDGRYAAAVAITSTVPDALATLALYDVTAAQWGAPLQLTFKNFPRSVGWLDHLRFVIADQSDSALGVRLFARAGMAVADLGFFALWGAGSATTRFTVGTAHFVPAQGGLLMLTGNSATNPTTLQACHLRLTGNGITGGAPFSLGGALPPLVGTQADIIPLGAGEYALSFGRTTDVVLTSFVPSASGAVITRPWQVVTLTSANAYIAPCLLGGRVVLVHKSVFLNLLLLSEVALSGSGFTLITDSVVIDGTPVFSAQQHLPWPLDATRLLLQSGTNVGLLFNELCIVSRYAGGDTLQNIVSDILDRAGYDAGDFDVTALGDTAVTGYVAQPPVTGRAALEPLRAYGAFDLIECDARLYSVPRHDAVAAAIPDDELRAAAEGQAQPAALELTRTQELDLPLEVTVDYIDQARDFEPGSARARRIASGATARAKLTLPVVCDADQAKRIAESRLFAAWAERTHAVLTVSRRYAFLDPGDVVTAGGRTWRLTSVRQAGGLLRLAAVAHYRPVEDSAARGDRGPIPVAGRALASSVPYLMDLPPLTGEADQPGLYVALSGPPGWRGGTLWRAADDVTYRMLDSFAVPVVAGVAMNALSDSGADYWDRSSSIEVQLVQGTLASAAATDVLNGANAAVLGDEIIQFRTATLLGPGYYRLSDLLRGRKGTESAMAGHEVGERFVLLVSGAVKFLPLLAVDRGRHYVWRALSSGQSLGDAVEVTMASDLRSLRPWAPAQLRGARAGSGDLTLSWVRRARLANEWCDYIDVPLDETQELYDLEILNGTGDVVRSVGGLTAAAYLYTVAQQSADFGGVPPNCAARVYQVSPRYGRGDAAQIVI